MGSRNYVWTLNNYSAEEETTLREMGTAEFTKFMVFGREIGEQGTPHLQGYTEFTKVMRMGAAKEYLQCPRLHLEIRRGTSDQAVVYCKKDLNFEVFGTQARQGSRTDLEDLKVSLDSGLSMVDISSEYFGDFLRYERGIRSYRNLQRGVRDWEMEVLIYYGPPGTGKTRKAYGFGECYFVPTPRSGSEVWWDGYDGEETIVLDDFYGWLRWSFLLKLLDRYPMQVPVKGGFAPMVSKRVVLTSNAHPRVWYDYNEKMCFGALLRRVTEVWHCKEIENWDRIYL